MASNVNSTIKKSIFYLLLLFLSAVITVNITFYVSDVEYGNDGLTNFKIPPKKSARFLELLEKRHSLTLDEVHELQKVTNEWNEQWQSQPFVDDLIPKNQKGRIALIRELLLEQGLTEEEIKTYLD